MNDSWFYADGSQPIGPLTLEQLQKVLAQPSGADILVWCERISDWQPAKNIPELSTRFVRPPPIPSGTSSRESGELQSAPTPVVIASDKIVDPSDKKGAETSKSKVLGWGASIGGALIGLTLSKIFGRYFGSPPYLLRLHSGFGIKRNYKNNWFHRLL